MADWKDVGPNRKNLGTQQSRPFHRLWQLFPIRVRIDNNALETWKFEARGGQCMSYVGHLSLETTDDLISMIYLGPEQGSNSSQFSQGGCRRLREQVVSLHINCSDAQAVGFDGGVFSVKAS